MKRKHYHVLVGLPGYLPNTNYPCRTLAGAGDMAYAEAESFREAGYASCWGEDSQGKVVGNKREGYEVLRPSLWPEQEDSGWPPLRKNQQWDVWQTISIVDCYEEDCFCQRCDTLLYECVCHECEWVYA